MEHIVIGTAGHIDHGKTTLIKALTGYDTDRLAEEKRRGITIELGFADFDLPDGRKVGIVDVPGHEKFIKNMVAGVVGMDLVLLIIAADEGIMPQTREHLDILELLGVKKCIIVLNKMDLVEPEWLSMVEEEIREVFQNTFFKDAPLVKVSAQSGEGIDELVRMIQEMIRCNFQKRDIRTIPRLPIDRVFTIAGFGTVVTGTLISGTISKDDVMTVYPLEMECRVRNIQVHGEDKERCYAGQRVALNFANIKKEEIKRGSVLALPDSMKSTRFLDAKLHLLDSWDRALKNNTRLHLLTGTDEVLCRAVLLDREELQPGESCYVQLRLEEELAVRRKDRFVVRFYSPLETIGGGVILEPNSVKKKRFRDEVIQELRQKEEGSLADVLELHLKALKDTMPAVSELARLTAYSEEEVSKALERLEEEKTVLSIPMKRETYVWHMDSYREAVGWLLSKLKEYEVKYPYRYGMKKAELQKGCFPKLKPSISDKLLERMESEKILGRKNELIFRAGYEIPEDDIFVQVSGKYIDAFTKVGYEFCMLSSIEIPEKSKKYAEDILNVLEERQVIVNIIDQFYTTKEIMDKAEEMIQKHFESNTIITIVQVKEMFNVSRKNAKHIIEYMDNRKITQKTGAETERTLYS
ncbi:MAG: selenocysteine-specific translation elongation factor [Ruminococcus sp.]|nr:selenocysteine-specific translation elongation factor [Ruminococcus sp.]